MSTNLLIGLFSALIGGGGIAALIQLVLLPRTIAKSKADTTEVIVGAAGEAVKLLRDQLNNSETKVVSLKDKLDQAEATIRTQDVEIRRLEERVRQLERRIERAVHRQDQIEDADDTPWPPPAGPSGS
jgi:predicted RNase H-like nuclease (RuvC/YqgF family)